MIEIVLRSIIPAAFAILPEKMDTQAAKAMLLAIGLQESRFQFRRQVNFGPARGFWQFEKAGIRGVSKHLNSRTELENALRVLRYESMIGKTADLHYAIEDNDILAAVFARLLLWTLPGRLPTIEEPALGWKQYVEAWRPGKPHSETWNAFFSEAWERVNLEEVQR